MLAFALTLLLSLLVFPLACLLLSFGVVWLLLLSLVRWLPMRVSLSPSAQLGACARTHAPAPARIMSRRFLKMSDCSCHCPDWDFGSALCEDLPFLSSADLPCSECPWFWSDSEV